MIGASDISFLMKFVYKSNVLGPMVSLLSSLLRLLFIHIYTQEDNLNFDGYEHIDLSARGVKTIPVILYSQADSIITLNISKNPMLDLPLDFIQLCTSLRVLRLASMAMKKVPQSVRHCVSLH